MHVGCDRTGVVAAVVLGLLDVPDDVIVEDYVASRRARIGRPSTADEEADSWKPLRHGAMRPGVTPEAMRAFLALVRVRCGSFTDYARAIEMGGAVRYLRTALLGR